MMCSPMASAKIPKTVDTCRSRITDKLGLSHRSELIRFALRVGLLSNM